MQKDVFNDYNKFKGLYNGLRNRSHYRAANKKSIEVIRDIEILKIKLIDLENYIDDKDIFQIVEYLYTLNINSNLENFIMEKPETENFWLTLWMFKEHSTPEDIIVKIGYKRTTSTYNASTGYNSDHDIYSPCVYTEKNLLMTYLVDYLLSEKIIKSGNYINPLRFVN